MFPKNVNFIGYVVFASCSKLESVYYFGVNAPLYNETKMSVFADTKITSVFVTNDYVDENFCEYNITV